MYRKIDVIPIKKNLSQKGKPDRLKFKLDNNKRNFVHHKMYLAHEKVILNYVFLKQKK